MNSADISISSNDFYERPFLLHSLNSKMESYAEPSFIGNENAFQLKKASCLCQGNEQVILFHVPNFFWKSENSRHIHTQEKSALGDSSACIS